MTMLGDNVGVICGLEDKTRKFKSYDLTTGQVLQSLNLENAYGLAEVKLHEKPALAVSYTLVETLCETFCVFH